MKKLFTIMIMSLLMVSLAFAASDTQANNTPTQYDIDGGNENPNGVDEAAKPILIDGCGPDCEVQIENQNQTQQRLRNGSFDIAGRMLQIREHAENMVQMQIGNRTAQTKMQINQQMVEGKNQLSTMLSNGRNALIKIMPDVAAENALQRLRIHVCNESEGCQIQLKEMMHNGEAKAVYQVQAQKNAKLFGLFKTKLGVTANIDAENGEVLETKKAWWGFLASEEDEEPLSAVSQLQCPDADGYYDEGCPEVAQAIEDAFD